MAVFLAVQLDLANKLFAAKMMQSASQLKVTKIYKFLGLATLKPHEAEFGDIIAMTGFTEPLSIGTTVCDTGSSIATSICKG